MSAHAQIWPNSDQESFESTIAKVGAPFSFSSLLCSRPVVAKLSEIFSEGAFQITRYSIFMKKTEEAFSLKTVKGCAMNNNSKI